jgi:hypothetical protein
MSRSFSRNPEFCNRNSDVWVASCKRLIARHYRVKGIRRLSDFFTFLDDPEKIILMAMKKRDKLNYLALNDLLGLLVLAVE